MRKVNPLKGTKTLKKAKMADSVLLSVFMNGNVVYRPATSLIIRVWSLIVNFLKMASLFGIVFNTHTG